MKSNTEREVPEYSPSPHSHSKFNADKKRVHTNCSYNSKRRGRTNILRMRKKTTMHARVFFVVSPNKCLQREIMSLENQVCANVHEARLRRFRATCSNTSDSGQAKDKTSIENLYATENGLRFVGAYVLVFESNRSNDEDVNEKLLCWHFGSEQVFNMAFIAWNTAEYHAEPYFPKRGLSKVEVV